MYQRDFTAAWQGFRRSEFFTFDLGKSQFSQSPLAGTLCFQSSRGIFYSWTEEYREKKKKELHPRKYLFFSDTAAIL